MMIMTVFGHDYSSTRWLVTRFHLRLFLSPFSRYYPCNFRRFNRLELIGFERKREPCFDSPARVMVRYSFLRQTRNKYIYQVHLSDEVEGE